MQALAKLSRIRFWTLLGFVVLGSGPGLMGQGTPMQAIPLATPEASALAGRKASYKVQVPGSGTWVDAGLAVTPADHLQVSATGQISLADGRITGADGAARGWKDLLRHFPLESAGAGALLARIGSSDAVEPFVLGASASQAMPASGELFLAANVSTDLAGTGSYEVQLSLSKAAAAAAPTQAPVNLMQAIPPALVNSLPRRVTDKQGNLGDVVNFAIVGTEAQVKQAFAAAGWVPVDKTDNDAVLHGLLATLSKEAYTAVPISTLYLFDRPQDLSYARAESLTVALVRHHLRVWKAGQQVDGQPLWVGSSTHDDGLERDDRNNGVTHHIDPNIDQERDFIEQSFAAAGVLASAAYATPADPVRDAKTATGGSFNTDGRVVFMALR